MATRRLSKLAYRFYAVLVVPLFLVSVVVALISFHSLETNAGELTAALQIQAKSNRILQLLLIQDDATKAILIDPSRLADFSEKKIAAYDEHKRLLNELVKETPSEAMRATIRQLEGIDENQLRPIDTAILEQLFTTPDAARQDYFARYEPARRQYAEAIQQLTKTADAEAFAANQDVRALNRRSIGLITLALFLGILVVVGAIHVLAGQVERSEENTRTLLSILSEGLFFFDRAGKIAPERSQAMDNILPSSDTVATLQDFAARYAGTAATDIDACLKLLWSDDDDGFFADFATSVTMLPRRLTRSIEDGRIVTVEYRPLNDQNGKLAKIVAVVADITEKARAEQEASRQAERVRKIAMAAANVASYSEFAAEAQRYWEAAAAATSPEELKRHLHTLKGSVATFEFTALAEGIHALEDLLAEEGRESPQYAPRFAALLAQWGDERRDLDQVLNVAAAATRVTLERDKLDRLVRHPALRAHPEIAALVEGLERIPLAQALAKYESYLKKLVDRRGDKQVRLAFDPASDAVTPAELQPLDGALIHIVRNSFDHGIEPVEEREAAGKAPLGTLTLSLRRAADKLELTIADDGAGIDGDKLAAKAVAQGLWTQEQAAAASPSDKLALIYAAGLSTKDAASDISGRGVGMDAVKALVTSLGGAIAAFSERGKGTRFVLTVPTAPGGSAGVQLVRKAV